MLFATGISAEWVVGGLCFAIVGMAGFFAAAFWKIWERQTKGEDRFTKYLDDQGLKIIKALDDSGDREETTIEALKTVADKIESWSRHEDERIKLCDALRTKYGDQFDEELERQRQQRESK